MSHHLGQASLCDWRTPAWILERCWAIRGGRGFALDPATSPDNPTHAGEFWTDKGESEDWLPYESVFCNPPWSRKDPRIPPIHWWAAIMWNYGQARPDGHLFGILPASTNAAWFHKYVWPAAICFPRGRIVFEPPPGVVDFEAPSIDTCVFYYGPDRELFRAEFEDKGHVVLPPGRADRVHSIPGLQTG